MAPEGTEPPIKNHLRYFAIMLNQIEEGAPWPRPATHARVVYLEEEEGLAIGEVVSYRPLTIAAPIYRCWATMRLATLEEWIGSWALQEIYVGIPEMGAVDAWHEALTRIEELKLNGEPFCGGVADIAKFFDQARIGLVYKWLLQQQCHRWSSERTKLTSRTSSSTTALQ